MKKAVTYRLEEDVIKMLAVIQKLQQEQISEQHPNINIKISLADIVDTAIRKEYHYWTGE